jgi:hypothetical protein
MRVDELARRRGRGWSPEWFSSVSVAMSSTIRAIAFSGLLTAFSASCGTVVNSHDRVRSGKDVEVLVAVRSSPARSPPPCSGSSAPLFPTELFTPSGNPPCALADSSTGDRGSRPIACSTLYSNSLWVMLDSTECSSLSINEIAAFCTSSAETNSGFSYFLIFPLSSMLYARRLTRLDM